MFNLDTYFNKFDYESVMDEILKIYKVEKDDDHIKRHKVELKKKIDEVTRKLKEVDLLRELPVLDNDFSSYVILSNTNIIEQEKREKYKQFLAKTIIKNFQDKIRDIIFPYDDQDIEKLNGSGFIILKFDSYEEAKLAATAMHGVNIVKTHKVNAVTYIDYERVIKMSDEFTPREYFSLENLIKWEESNFIEMMYLQYVDRVIVGKIHFLKKEFSLINTIPIPENSEVKWSSQGKYLIINTGDKICFYGGEDMTLKFENKNSVKNYCLSSYETHLISFTGINEKDLNKENVFIWDLLGDELLRGFTINKDEKFENFKWSPNGKFFGRIKKDILIIYESPKMQIIPDANGVRQPLKDNVKDFHWFPNKSILIAITEKRNKKGNLDESILSFYEIPSRKDFGNSVLSALEIHSLEWNKYNNILAVICKSQEKIPSWTIRIFEFDINKQSYRSSTTSLKNDSPYFSLSAKWIGNDLFIAPKYKDGNLDTINIYPYKLNKVSLNIDAWASDKSLKALKYSHFIPSSGQHFLLGCLDQNNRNSYGRVDLYAVFDNTINYCKTFDFQNTLSNLVWDFGGRLFTAEFFFKGIEGFKLYDTLGNLIYDNRDVTIQKINWRPRHYPILERTAEEEDIKKNYKTIGKNYDEEDSEFLSEIDKNKRAIRKRIREDFMSVVNKRRDAWEKSKQLRESLYVEPESVYVEVDVVREEIMNTFEEIISTE